MLIIYTGGTFDIPHMGHANFLYQCSLLGSVVVSLNTDDFVAEYKGKSPLMSYEQRKETLLNCSWVSAVIPNEGGQDSKPAILQVNPDIIAIASDWAKKDYYAQMSFTQEWLDEHQISLIYVPYFKGISTTKIKELFNV